PGTRAGGGISLVYTQELAFSDTKMVDYLIIPPQADSPRRPGVTAPGGPRCTGTSCLPRYRYDAPPPPGSPTGPMPSPSAGATCGSGAASATEAGSRSG